VTVVLITFATRYYLF